MEQFFAVLRRALMLDEGAWGEIRDNTSFTAVAVGLAVIAVVLAGLGAFLWGEITAEGSTPDGWFVDTIILGSLFVLLLLALAIVVIYLVLTQMFGETVAPDALLRVLAVATAPFALGFLFFVPELNFWLGMMSFTLMFFMAVFGLRAAFSLEWMRAFTAVAAGLSVFLIVMALLISVDNRWTPGVFVLESLEDSWTKSYDSGSSSDIDINLDDLFQNGTGE